MVVAKNIRWYAVPFLLLLVTATFVTAVNSELIDEASNVVEEAEGAADHVNSLANHLESLALEHGESASRPPSGVVEDVRGSNRPFAAMAEAEGSSSRSGGRPYADVFEAATWGWTGSPLNRIEILLSKDQLQAEENLFALAKTLAKRKPEDRKRLMHEVNHEVNIHYDHRRKDSRRNYVEEMVSRSPLYFSAKKHAEAMNFFLGLIRDDNPQSMLVIKSTLEDHAQKALTTFHDASERVRALIDAEHLMRDRGALSYITLERRHDHTAVREFYNEVVARARQRFPDLQASDIGLM